MFGLFVFYATICSIKAVAFSSDYGNYRLILLSIFSLLSNNWNCNNNNVEAHKICIICIICLFIVYDDATDDGFSS